MNTPILFIIYNRPETTQAVFDVIKSIKPSRLFIAADGPKTEQDVLLCEQARSIIKQIDWDTDCQTRFLEKNMGCKLGVSSAISWFFDQVEAGIILEDDCEFLYTFRQHARRIEAFILQHPKLGAYNLGGLPLLSYPVSCEDLRGLLFGFAHAVIYTKHGRTQLQHNSIRILHDLECSMTIKMYFPALPLAVQKIEQTENSKNWDLGGLSFCYLNLFGSKLFHIHHIFGWFGGLASVVLSTITCTVLVLIIV